MASLGSYLPPPGSAVWGRGRTGESGGEENKARHVVIRDAEILEKPSPHVVYKIEVLTEHDHWHLYRRYSQFHALHRKLMKQYGVSRDLLPPKKIAGNLSKALIDKRRQLLERYLQKLIHSESQISQSQELLSFLDIPAHDVVKVADILTRHLFHHGDLLLEEGTPIALSVNEMYSITRRLRLPRDAQGIDPSDVTADPAHLYGFVHQLKRLRISVPPPPSSVCCMPFEITPFRSLLGLKLDGVPLSQLCGLISVQQQLEKLSVHRTLRTLREILIDAVEEKRGVAASASLPEKVEAWRLTATAKLTDNRVVVQPWLHLHTLSLTHNHLTHLDDSLQVLPALRELNLSHNLIQVLDLQFLCLPSLQKLTVAHNAINKILDNRKVLERITYLNLSHNRLHSLNGLHAFVAVETLQLSYNLVASRKDLDRLTQLRHLRTLAVIGNPIAASHAARLMVLGKFMHKSRTVFLDGQEATTKEQAKLQSMRERYGPDPEHWPLAKTLVVSTGSNSSGEGEEGEGRGEGEQHDPTLEVTWQVHSPHSTKAIGVGSKFQPVTSTPQRQGQRSFDQSLISQNSFEEPLLTHRLTGSHLVQGGIGFIAVEDEEHYSIGSLISLEGVLPSREDPDGQSDISVTSPGIILIPPGSDPPSHSLTPPPSTPLTTNGTNKPLITPTMIQSALEALQQIQNKGTPISLTPNEDTPTPIFPEAITSALAAWISSHSASGTPHISPPPSTPMEGSQDRPHNAISASDLISALRSLIPSQEAGSNSNEESGENSAVCSVPQCTPQDGVLTEWIKLGIRPEEVIQALSALTIHRTEEEEGQKLEEHASLSPISEERSSLPSSLHLPARFPSDPHPPPMIMEAFRTLEGWQKNQNQSEERASESQESGAAERGEIGVEDTSGEVVVSSLMVPEPAEWREDTPGQEVVVSSLMVPEPAEWREGKLSETSSTEDSVLYSDFPAEDFSGMSERRDLGEEPPS